MTTEPESPPLTVGSATVTSWPASVPPSDPYRVNYQRWASEPNQLPPRLSVVIPAYNEEWRILPTVGAVATHVCELLEPWELIVADDGSTDDTVDLVSGLNLPNAIVLRAERNGGKGSAVRRGVLAARGDLILVADADQSTPIQFLSALVGQIEQGADLVVGSRHGGQADVANKSQSRALFSSGLRVIQRRTLGIQVNDTQCGFKLFRREVAHTLFRRQIIDGFAFDLEILFLASRLGYRVDELPVTWFDAPGSKVRAGRDAIGFLRDIARIRMNDHQGRYRADLGHPDRFGSGEAQPVPGARAHHHRMEESHED